MSEEGKNRNRMSVREISGLLTETEIENLKEFYRLVDELDTVQEMENSELDTIQEMSNKVDKLTELLKGLPTNAELERRGEERMSKRTEYWVIDNNYNLIRRYKTLKGAIKFKNRQPDRHVFTKRFYGDDVHE